MVYTLTSDMIKNVGNTGEVRGLVTDYSLKDLCLVRATDYYEDINLKSLTQAKMLKKDYSIFFKSLIQDTDINDVGNFYSPYHSTIHFTLNGLHSSFYDSNYIIIEPLITHIQDKNLLSLRAEDTLFEDEMFLSKKAIIIMPLKEYDQDKFKNIDVVLYDFPQDFKHQLFSDTQNSEMLLKIKIVEAVLEMMGYPHFKINNQGFIGVGKEQMEQLLEDIRMKEGIGAFKYSLSKMHYEENLITLSNKVRSDLNHLIFLIQHSNIKNEQIIKIIPLLNKIYQDYSIKDIFYDELGNCILKSDIQKIIYDFYHQLGLDEYKKLTNLYNNLMIENQYQRSR